MECSRPAMCAPIRIDVDCRGGMWDIYSFYDMIGNGSNRWFLQLELKKVNR